MKRYQKIIASILLISFSGYIAVRANFASAQGIALPAPSVPSYESNPYLNVYTANINFLEGQQTSQQIYEWVFQTALEYLKHAILQQITEQIIAWIQGGGKAKFALDFGNIFENAVDATIGEVIQNSDLGFLCDPFKLQIKIGLLPVPDFKTIVDCTLTDIVGNINNFYGSFLNGGWLAYNASLEPRNNYYGALFLSAQFEDDKIAKAVDSLNSELSAGGGFLSTKSCKEALPENFLGPDIDGDGSSNDIESTCIITTPGDFVGQTVVKAFALPLDGIISAKDLNAYVSAIANAFFNQLIISGVNGLLGVTTPNSPPGGSIPPGGGPCAGLSGAALAACQNFYNQYGGSYGNATSTLVQQINSVIGPRVGAAPDLKDSATQLQAYIDPTLVYWYNWFFAPQNCQSVKPSFVQKYQQAVTDEQTFASGALLSVQNDDATNQNIITSLQNFLAQVNALSPNDWSGFTALQNQIASSGLLDPAGALVFQTNADQQNKAIIQQISSTSAAPNGLFYKNQAACQACPPPPFGPFPQQCQ